MHVLMEKKTKWKLVSCHIFLVYTRCFTKDTLQVLRRNRKMKNKNNSFWYSDLLPASAGWFGFLILTSFSAHGVLAGATRFTKCAHPALGDEERDIIWLEEGSDQHKALHKIVNNKQILTDISRLTHFCHTGQLENYHSVLLRWCPKSNYFFLKACTHDVSWLDCLTTTTWAESKPRPNQAHFAIVWSSQRQKVGGSWRSVMTKLQQKFSRTLWTIFTRPKWKCCNGVCPLVCVSTPSLMTFRRTLPA